MQVDVFSFGVVIYELLVRQVTSAVVSQSGDANMPEMYANKVNSVCKLLLLPLVHLKGYQSDVVSLKMISCFVTIVGPSAVICAVQRQAAKYLCNVFVAVSLGSVCHGKLWCGNLSMTHCNSFFTFASIT